MKNVNATGVNAMLKPAPQEILLKPTTIVQIHDTETHITYKISVRDLAKAVVRQMIADGELPARED